MLSYLKQQLENLGLSAFATDFMIDALCWLYILAIAFIANIVASKFLLRGMEYFVSRTKTRWDDIIQEKKVFNRLSRLAPALVIYLMVPTFFAESPWTIVITRITLVWMALITTIVLDNLLTAIHDIYKEHPISNKYPIKGYLQAVKLMIYCFAAIGMVSLVINQSPALLFSGLGALTAVLLLIFREPILGFVAGIQLAGNNMIQPGDWIEMSKYGADGDVIDVTLTTVKVQNWNKTITHIPIYALISDSFTNWRGMMESGGRRIKRAVHIDLTTIRFCDEEMLAKYEKINLLKSYLAEKRSKLQRVNAGLPKEELLNGLRLTNIGTFRAYLTEYLKSIGDINQEMTFIVRQLPSGPEGLPIEIYVFCSDKRWAYYEALQSDIFDHIYAMVQEFDLQLFQSPTGWDIRSAVQALNKPLPSQKHAPNETKGPQG